VPSCHICGHCRHRCSYLGCFATVEIRKRPRCAVERDWSASGFPRKALNRMLAGPQCQSRLEVDSCSKPTLCVLEGIRPSRRRRLASAHRNIAEALKGACTHTGFLPESVRLRSWSFSHVPALPLPVVSLILNAARERCLYIEIGFIQTEVCKTVVRHRQVQTCVQVPMQIY